MKAFCLLVFGFVLVVPSFAEDDLSDGNHLQTYCAQNGGFGAGICIGIINAVSDFSHLICAPDSVTFGQEIKVVQKFLADNPDKLHLKSSLLVEQALSKAFPCPSKIHK